MDWQPLCPRTATAVLHLLLLSAAIGQNEPVTTLRGDSFDWFIKSHSRAFVSFYQPDCKFCQALEPEFQQVAKVAKEEGWQTKFAKIDAGPVSHVMDRYKLTAVPSLVYFVKGQEPEVYDSKVRHAHSFYLIKQYVQKHEQMAIVELRENSVDSFLQKMDIGRFTLVAHVQKRSLHAKAYVKATKRLARNSTSEYRFAVVWLQADDKTNAAQKPMLYLHRAGFAEPDARRHDFAGSSWSVVDIVKWANAGTYQTVGSTFTASRYSVDALQELGWEGSVVAVIDDASIEEDEDEEPVRPRIMPELLALAKENPQWRFTTVELTQLKHQDLLALDESGHAPPTPVVYVLYRKHRYLLKVDLVLTSGTLTKFFDSVKNGLVRPVYRSADHPAVEVNSHGVTEIVGSTFEEIALDPSKDVFVKFYASYCNHCKEMIPTWNALAEAVNKSGLNKKGVVIAQMDGTENECEEGGDLREHGFPRIVLYPAVAAARKIKEKQVYPGARKVEHFLDFIRDHAQALEGKGASSERGAEL